MGTHTRRGRSFSFLGLSLGDPASSPDGVPEDTKYGSIYVFSFNSDQSVSNIFVAKFVRHLATKLFLNSGGSLPMFLSVILETHLHVKGKFQWGKAVFLHIF